MSSENLTANPFPGLRPFDASENHLFFGRDGQSDELLRRLRRQRFIAVVGTSGSGKSSLVRAGLLPALHGGFMLGAGSNWRVAVFRPGNDPVANLAQALRRDDVFGGGGDEDDAAIQLSFTEATLRRSALGLIDVVRQARVPAHDNLLVVVDQFEELFRVRGAERADDAAAFVKLLLEATRQTELPIYVLITMRSDFLGDCTQFRDLPEAINDGQYLIPRMTRDQRREAVTGPVAVGGAEIAPRLVNRLLNEAGDNSDQLPLLQHALMRTWQQWEKGGRAGPLDLSHYEAVGGLTDAISQHAEEVYGELPDERARRVAEILFKLLTERGPDNREIRRPTRLSEVCAVADASEDEVRAVVEVFRGEGRSFLMPPPGTPLRDDTFIDISHESLIRGWRRLQRWVDDEALSARIFRRLDETAALYRGGEAGLWRDPDLSIALAWRDKYRPNAAWGARYSPGFDEAMAFLDESRRARDAELAERERVRRKTLRLTQALAAVLLLGLCVSVALGGVAYYKWKEAAVLTRQAEKSAHDAQDNARRAEESADRARQAEAQALADKERASQAEARAKASAELAEKKEQEARDSLAAVQAANKQLVAARHNLEAALLAARRAQRLAEERKLEAESNARQAKASAERASNLSLRFRRNSIQGGATQLLLAGRLESVAPSPERVHWLNVRGEALTNLGNPDRAIEVFTEALKEDPDNFLALNHRGYQYMITKQPQKALADIEHALRLNDKAPNLYINKANNEGYLGRYGDAIDTLRRGIAAFTHYGFGEYSQHDVAEEIKQRTGQKLIYADSDDALTAIHFGMASLAATAGSAEFEELLGKAVNRPASPGAHMFALNWALLNHQTRAEDYGSLVAQGILWRRAGYCREAQSAFEKFKAEHARLRDRRYDRLSTWLARPQTKEMFAAGGDCVASPAEARAPATADVRTAREHLLDGIEYAWSGNPRAEISLSEAIKLDPNNPDFLVERMKFRYYQGNNAGAKEDAERVLNLAPNSGIAYLFRALAKVQLNSDDGTIVADARRAKELSPAAVTAVDEQPANGRALVERLAITNLDDALDYLARSARYNQPSPYPHYLAAKLLNGKGDYDKALEHINKAISLNGGRLEFYDEKLRAEEGRRRGAKDADAASIAARREKAREFGDAGRELLRTGKTGEALFAFGESLKLLDGIVRQKSTEEVRCEVAAGVERIFRLIEQQGSKGEAAAYIETQFRELTAIADIVRAELKQLAAAR